MPFGEFASKFGADGSESPEDMRRLFDEYVAIGGIPEAVEAWDETRDIASVDTVLSDMLYDLISSISDERGEAFGANCRRILRSIPRQLSGNNRKFMYGSVSPGLRLRDLRGRASAADVIIVTKSPAYIDETHKREWISDFLSLRKKADLSIVYMDNLLFHTYCS